MEANLKHMLFLGQAQEMYGALLVPVVLEKPPPEIHKKIAREHDSDNISLIELELRKSIVYENKILKVVRTTDYIGNYMTTTFSTE